MQQDSIDSIGAKVTDPTVNKLKFLTSNNEYAATRIQTAFRAYKVCFYVFCFHAAGPFYLK
ncbi:hypothetical protein HanRHA438_Chr03g0126961 [Helianthus annuus]|nr:hypothetical protein HanRHA438_Chr03g0126961 [Helianthus annuus]